MALADGDFFNLCRVHLQKGGKARAESLRKTRTEVMAKKLADPALKEKYELIPSGNLHKGISSSWIQER